MATNLPPLDTKFAPPGMVAVDAYSGGFSCTKCALYPSSCRQGRCLSHTRPDKHMVFFVIDNSASQATASWPYDDMGTPVITGEQQ